MKIPFFIFLIILVLFYNGTAQPISNSIVDDELKAASGPKIFPIPGSHVLRQKWQKTELILKARMKTHADERAIRKLMKATAWNFTVGQTRNWWATNIDESDSDYYTEYLTPSTCRAVGSNCYIFVEDSLWVNETVNQAAVDSIRTAFELRTPADASKGIFQLDTMYFGDPPDLDNDPKIIILILDIKDGFTGTGGYVAGYFYAQNEYPESIVNEPGTNRHSNEAEIYYIDANPANLKTSHGVTAASSTTAHEFQHMIFWHYSYINDIEKLTFIDEGMSMSASKLCGYKLESPSLYYSNTNVDFLSWGLSGDALPDYSRTALFSWYLIEQFGSPLTKSIVQNSYDSAACYDNAFQTSGSPSRFIDVLKNFALAAEINNTIYDPRYGFTEPISIKPAAVTYYSPIISAVTDSLKPFGTRYVKFSGGQSLSLNISSGGTIEVKAIATGTAGIKVDNITPGTTYTLSDFGISYSSVVLAVTNLTKTETVFTYSASGTGNNAVELKYDLTEPTGYLPGTAGDTVCVWFNGITDGRLDSVRVAFRRPGTIAGGIWKYTGDTRPSPLGRQLALVTAVSAQPAPTYPYPVPWPNWATIDLSAKNVDASEAFAVAFVNQGDGTSHPRVMITESPMPSETTSLTFLSDETEWYYLTSNTAGDSVYTYLIRAYVSIDTTGEEPDTSVTQVTYVLEQNFPNPFNPLTVIRFQIPSDRLVKLKIYDIMGREVATLVDGFHKAGIHDVKLDASNLASGVYLYRITAGSFAETKKLVVIK